MDEGEWLTEGFEEHRTRPALINGTAGVVAAAAGRVLSVMGFTVAHEKIVAIDVLYPPRTPGRPGPGSPRRLTVSTGSRRERALMSQQGRPGRLTHQSLTYSNTCSTVEI